MIVASSKTTGASPGPRAGKNLVEDIIIFSQGPAGSKVCADYFEFSGRNFLDLAMAMHRVLHPEATRLAALTHPNAACVDARKSILLEDLQTSSSHTQVQVIEKLQYLSELAYDFARALMRSGLKNKMVHEVVGRAKSAWFYHLESQAKMDIRKFYVGTSALEDTCNIWLEQAVRAFVDLGDCASLPPFFDGNIQLVQLYLHGLPPEFDFSVLGPAHLSNLRCLALYQRHVAQLDIAAIRKILPHLKNVHEESEPSGRFYVLYVDDYGALPTVSGSVAR